MIAVALVSETHLDRTAFGQASFGVTGKRHIAVADKHPSHCRLGDDLQILQDFGSEIASSALYVGFLFAGFAHDVREVIEYTRGMTHMYSPSDNPMLACALVTGNLSQWRVATIEGCQAHRLSTAREAYNKVYQEFRKRGMFEVFDGVKVSEQRDGTFLLLEHK